MQEQPVERAGAYEPPVLAVLGSVTELTEGSIGAEASDGLLFVKTTVVTTSVLR